MEYLVLPGYGSSGPGHWQSLWQEDPAFRRVEQKDWGHPDRGDWVTCLEVAVAETPGPVVLVAHSLACLLTVHWAAEARRESLAKVKGAFLVAPTDPAAPEFPRDARGFAPVPRNRLPFRSVVAASSDDPYASLDFAREYARVWGSDLFEVGFRGHINAASGLGTWEEGKTLMKSLAC